MLRVKAPERRIDIKKFYAWIIIMTYFNLNISINYGERAWLFSNGYQELLNEMNSSLASWQNPCKT